MVSENVKYTCSLFKGLKLAETQLKDLHVQPYVEDMLAVLSTMAVLVSLRSALNFPGLRKHPSLAIAPHTWLCL